MSGCTVCKRGSLRLIGEKTEILPTPMGTNWPAVPIKVYKYECANCVSTFEQRNDGAILLREKSPGLKDLILEYFFAHLAYLSYQGDLSRSVSLRNRLLSIGDSIIPTLLESLVATFKVYGRDFRKAVISKKDTNRDLIESELSALVDYLISPAADLLSRMDETVYLKLCHYLDSKDKELQRASIVLLYALFVTSDAKGPSDSTSKRVILDIQGLLKTKTFGDSSYALLLMAIPDPRNSNLLKAEAVQQGLTEPTALLEKASFDIHLKVTLP